MKKVLICGISGQDGAYLAKRLLDRGCAVWGSSRDAQTATFSRLRTLGIHDRVSYETIALNDFRSVLQALKKITPDAVFNLAGQSSVGLSFQLPVETIESVTMGTLNILEAIRFSERPIRFYNACSSECFGETGEEGADENTPFRPRSPYAAAKAAAFWLVANYREAYGMYACSGILFNHESPLRPERFVTRKIIKAAVRIAKGSDEKLRLGLTAIKRDWGWAPEYAEAMRLMLEQDSAADFVIATGETNSLDDFVAEAFRSLGLDCHDHVETDPSLFRPSEIMISRGNPRKAAQKLGWSADSRMREVVRMMVEAELRSSTGADHRPPVLPGN